MTRRRPLLSRERAPAPRWIHAEVRGPEQAAAGSAGRFEIHLGVLTPLWAGTSIRITWPLGWTPPVVESGPGQVAWRVNGRGLILAERVRRRTLQLNLTGGSLQPGDAVVMTYGGQPEGATVQPWLTDIPARFEVTLDRAATGRFTLEAWATVALVPGPPAHLHVVDPSILATGQGGTFRVALLDCFGNLCPAVAGTTYYYLRAVQVDEETAWSSPVWVTWRPA